MAILVDDLREYPDVALPFTTWCHMTTDGDVEELHAFAARLGLQRRWFQRDHYDLPPHGRRAAVALGAEAVATGELLRRMTGPRGDRARRRALAPAGVAWLRGGTGPAVLRYPAGALVAIGGPPGAGKSALAARAVDADRVPVLDPDDLRGVPEAPAAWRAALATALAAGGAVAVTTALRHEHRLRLAEAAAAAGATAHLLLLEAEAAMGEWAAYRRVLRGLADPAPFASITILDRPAANRVRRIAISTSSRG